MLGWGELKGLCGTALVDVVAGFLETWLIDPGRHLLPEGDTPFSSRIRGEGNDRRFLITGGTKPIGINQQDIRELQLAKGAIRAGVEVLSSRLGISADEVVRVYLARARITLLNHEALAEAERIARKIECIEPSCNKVFSQFIDAVRVSSEREIRT